MDRGKIHSIQVKILDLIVEEYGFIPLEEGVLILSELLPAIIKACEPDEVVPEVGVEILPDQALDVIQISKERPAIDRDDYSLAEKLENDAVSKIIDKPYKKKKAVSVEEFKEVRRLDEDELF